MTEINIKYLILKIHFGDIKKNEAIVELNKYFKDYKIPRKQIKTKYSLLELHKMTGQGLIYTLPRLLYVVKK